MKAKDIPTKTASEIQNIDTPGQDPIPTNTQGLQLLFEEYLSRWQLLADGDPIVTPGARLLPVCRRNEKAMLKIATIAEEQSGGQFMDWWEGRGAAKVLAIEGNALLLERAMGTQNLVELSQGGKDDEATRIICNTIAVLHAPRNKHLPDLTSLETWFQSLQPAAQRYGGLFVRSAETAKALLSDPQDVVALHGDIHHGNILDFGPKGWLAIDPKGLYGERSFDYANLFCNPNRLIAADHSLFLRRLQMVSERARIDRDRLLQWIIAWCGLSAAWMIEDGHDGDSQMTVAQFAIAEQIK